MQVREFVFYDELAPRFKIPYTMKHLRDLEKDGNFPKRHRLTPGGRVLWYVDELVEWLNSRPVVVTKPEDVSDYRPKVIRPQPRH